VLYGEITRIIFLKRKRKGKQKRGKKPFPTSRLCKLYLSRARLSPKSCIVDMAETSLLVMYVNCVKVANAAGVLNQSVSK
jgi:hypothetical protein